MSSKKQLREALAFYADPDTYFAIGIFPDPPNGEFMDDFSDVGEFPEWPVWKPGWRARMALGWKPERRP